MMMSKNLKEEIFNFLDENIKTLEDMERKEIIYLLKKKFDASEGSLSRYYTSWKKVYMLPKDSIKAEFEIKKDIILKGKYAEYLINENGITVGDLNFKSLKEIIDYEHRELAQFNKRILELKAAIQYVGAEC